MLRWLRELAKHCFGNWRAMTTLPLGWIIFRGSNFREFSLEGADSGSQFEMPVLSHLKYGNDCNAAGALMTCRHRDPRRRSHGDPPLPAIINQRADFPI